MDSQHARGLTVANAQILLDQYIKDQIEAVCNQGLSKVRIKYPRAKAEIQKQLGYLRQLGFFPHYDNPDVIEVNW